MKIEQVAVQLYTLRNFLKTPDEVATSLKKVADIGYKSVQLSGLCPMPEADVVKICADNGLTINSTLLILIRQM